MHVVVADDELLLRLPVTEALVDAGRPVEAVGDGLSALEAFGALLWSRGAYALLAHNMLPPHRVTTE